MREIGVGLLGLGNVGSGVVKLLAENSKAIEARLGARVAVRKIAVQKTEKRRLVELIGGETPARAYLARAIEQKKHVVTANKLLLAMHGDELFGLAEKQGVD